MINPDFMQLAIDLALEGINNEQSGPFGAVIVKQGEIIGVGTNRVTSSKDPTAHAEVSAIRNACLKLNNFSLAGCEIYTSCEPCPMCLGAIFWARLDKIYYAANRADAARANFDDSLFYEEIKKAPEQRLIPMTQIMHQESLKIFSAWDQNTNKIPY